MDLNIEYTSIEKKLINTAEKKLSPISGSFELLPVCNMNCDMCYVRLSSKQVDRLGGLLSVEQWISIAKQLRDAGVLFLLLTGGEPLLYPGIKELFCALQDMGMILTINTNGTLLDEDWAEFFSKNQPRRINITLYGASTETYGRLCHYPQGFERVMHGVKLLQDYGVPVKFGCSATKLNQDDILDIIKIGKDMNVPVTVDTYMMPAVRERGKEYSYDVRLNPEEAARIGIQALQLEMGEEIFKQYRERTLWEIDNILPDTEVQRMKCHAGKSSFTINWQGKMRPCVIMSDPTMSVLECGFNQAWQHIVEQTSNIVLNPKCGLCNLRPICRTCAACALLEAGAYDAMPDYMCRYAKESERKLRVTLIQDGNETN